ncbi:MAG: hypothetical protein MSS85_07555 [Pyramidobacter sp.]|uniref:hypothetical protein n=1 Tax=Pyramidobacter sp. TaxID=1943581 RepID=UPI0025F7F5D5|nr:hypothetical protein [Pyramidobacter sp.]MCI7403925.1 hypothetical protein [Pyramidobacter sp.]
MAELERFGSRLRDLRDDAYRVIAEREEVTKKGKEVYYMPDIDHKLLAAAKRASLDLSYELPKWRKAVKE